MTKKIIISLNENQANRIHSVLNSYIFDAYDYYYDGGAAPLDRQLEGEIRTLKNVIDKITKELQGE